MLGAFFRIRAQLGRVAFVFRDRGAAAAGAGDRTDLDRVTAEANVQFRRAAHERELLPELKAKHVGRGIDETQAAIEIERVTFEIQLEALR